jgi:hypothetical protein
MLLKDSTVCNQSVSQSVGRTVVQSVGRSFSQLVSLSVGRLLSRSVGQRQSVSRSVGRSVSLSVGQSVSLSVGRSVSQSVCRSVSRSVSLSVCRSFGQSVSQADNGFHDLPLPHLLTALRKWHKYDLRLSVRRVSTRPFTVVTPWSLVEVCRRFSGACCIHHHRLNDGGSRYLWNVSNLLAGYTASQARRQPFSGRYMLRQGPFRLFYVHWIV